MGAFHSAPTAPVAAASSSNHSASASLSVSGTATHHVITSDDRKKSFLTTLRQKKKIASIRKDVDRGTDDYLISKIMMPLYYVNEPIKPADIQVAASTWSHIVNNTSPEFHALKATLPYPNCRIWFETIFYDRLFDVHPMARMLFRDPTASGTLVTAFFTFILELFSDETKLNKKLYDLADTHNKRGIKSGEYAIWGDVLFWTLHKVLGRAYTADAHFTWVKLYSRILKVVIPLAAAAEMDVNNAQIFRKHVMMENPDNKEYVDIAKEISDQHEEKKRPTNVSSKVSSRANCTVRSTHVAPDVAGTGIKPSESTKTVEATVTRKRPSLTIATNLK